MLDKKFFFKIGPEVVAKFRKHTFNQAKDIDGKQFKAYSSSYAKAKGTGKLPRQATEFANSTAPVLTSDLMRDFTMRRVTDDQFEFGTLAQGGKVENLTKLGRVISKKDKPLPNEIVKFLQNESVKYIQKTLQKTVKTKIKKKIMDIFV